MISIFSASKRKPAYSPPSIVKPRVQAANFLSNIGKEAKRREEIIKHLVSTFKVKEGDEVLPYIAAAADMYGTLKVEKICDSYAKYGKNSEWPEDDNPMLIHVYSEKADKRLICTQAYLKV